MEELFEQLVKLFSEDNTQETSEFSFNGQTVKTILKKDDNEISLVIKLEDDPFKKYINSLDEDVFIEACEKYEQLTGEHLSNETDPEHFKEVVKQIITARIESYKKFL